MWPFIFILTKCFYKGNFLFWPMIGDSLMLNGYFVNSSSTTTLVWGNTGQGYTRQLTSLFSQGDFSLSPNHTSFYPAVSRDFLPSPSFPLLFSLFKSLIPQPSLLLLSSHCAAEWQLVDVACEEFSWRCVVWVCGLHSAQRLLTGWMRESKTV